MLNLTKVLHLLIAVLGVFAAAPAAMADKAPLPDYVIAAYGHPPAIPEGAVAAPIMADLQRVFVDSLPNSAWGAPEKAALARIAAAQDPRLAWVIADMMRFTWRLEFDNAQARAAEALLGIPLDTPRRRARIVDHLIAWDVPSFPGYLEVKRAIFTNFVPGWDRIFAEGDVDWRLVDWGGVKIDARPYGQTDEICNCIPAIDNPRVVGASQATWPAEDDIVFGISVNGEHRAYPRQIMEVREMVNDTLGGRDLGIPYCTLCGAAQAYFTDDVPEGVERPVLRTSGLLIRSNKVMFDINTYSVFDTFLGRALTGPVAEHGVTLSQATVLTTTWGAWKAAHPDTTVLTEDQALGRDYDFRNTRDANGPIFPVGDVDPRLPVHEDVIGVLTASGQPIAFPRSRAVAALTAGAGVSVQGIRLHLDAGGIRATDETGAEVPSHQAFWFAWSQFHPGTVLWQR